MLEHGGRLRDAARRYGIDLNAWLDLSTGINPLGYPVPPVPAEAWLRLPEAHDGLEDAAANYYGTAAALPVAGSQAAIQLLPALIPGERIGILTPTYGEHAHAWRTRQPLALSPAGIEAAIDTLDVLILTNPNNPTGEHFAPAQLLAWHRRLAARGGWLIVDEAFVDTTPELSLAPSAGLRGLIVLRSLGKFFGLAGARVGFVLASGAIRHALSEHLGPWTIAGPARFAACAALDDRAWQAATRLQLTAASSRLSALLHSTGLGKPTGTALFQRLATRHAPALADALARKGILVRVFDDPPSLRFGLPGTEPGWRRLTEALAHCAPHTRPPHHGQQRNRPC